MFNGVKSKLIGDEAGLEKELEALRGKLHDRFRYAALFKDAAELQREQEEKRKQQQQRQLQQQENNAATTGEVVTKLSDLTIETTAAVDVTAKGKN